jgi:maleylacetate reductase
MEAFTYVGLPARVLFGDGTIARAASEAEALGASRVMVITTTRKADDGRNLREALGAIGAGVYAKAAMHTPVDVTEDALAEVKRLGIDCVIALGGGSTTGLAKAIALRTDLPQIAIPTTYAGSEMTPILGQTEGGRKTTLKSMKVLPETVIYDVDLTMGLPALMSGTSGINAIAHCVEALYAQEANPVISIMAEQSVAALGRALPLIAANPADRQARSDALYGAFLAGACLGAVGMALHHKLCHTLGGTFDLPHAETHTVVLPHALAYNTPAASQAANIVARALGVGNAADGLFALAGKVGAPRALRELGMPESGIDEATDLALANPYWNPRPLERAGIRALIARAWAGERPLEEAA